MPLPFLIAAGAIIGIAGHIDAKDKNERAIRKSNEAQDIYYSAKNSLEKAQKVTEESLIQLGYAKKNDLDYFLNKFINCYEKIKSVEIKESVGLNEINNFNIDQQGVLEIRQMNDIYSESFSSGATGAAAGTAIALAVSGAMPVVTGSLSLAGTAFTMGEIGMAASFAGSAFSFAAAMTPLSAIAAPVIMFTGISASMKADENLEEARVMKAEAVAAAEKMKVSQTLCNGIKDRSDMFLDLLNQLNGMFYESTELLIRVVNEKERNGLRGKLTSGDFTLEEKRLISITRSLAGAVKAVIDTPILSKEGVIDNKADELYHKTVEQLPEYERKVAEVRNLKIITQSHYNNDSYHAKADSNNYYSKFVIGVVATIISIAILCVIVFIMNKKSNKVTFENTNYESIDDTLNVKGNYVSYSENNEINSNYMTTTIDNTIDTNEHFDNGVHGSKIYDEHELIDQDATEFGINETTSITPSKVILDDSDSTIYSYKELSELTEEELNIAVSEIYARHDGLVDDDILNTFERVNLYRLEKAQKVDVKYFIFDFNESFLGTYAGDGFNIRLYKDDYDNILTEIEDSSGVKSTFYLEQSQDNLLYILPDCKGKIILKEDGNIDYIIINQAWYTLIKKNNESNSTSEWIFEDSNSRAGTFGY